VRNSIFKVMCRKIPIRSTLLALTIMVNYRTSAVWCFLKSFFFLVVRYRGTKIYFHNKLIF